MIALRKARILLFFFFFFFFVSFLICSSTSSSSSELSVSVLLEFKQSLIDDAAILTDWKKEDNTTDPCLWTGILCNPSGVVVGLNFTNFNLSGDISSVVCGLPTFSQLWLSFNNFNLTFPYPILQHCPNLTALDLSQNYFYGPLQLTNISHLSMLTWLDLSHNCFDSSIPPSLGDLPNLQYLSLVGNTMGGAIPPELGKLSKLETLDLSWNQFNTSAIPAELGNLTNLRYLYLEGNKIPGGIPASLGSLTNLVFLDISQNLLTGVIPEELMFLQKLTHFELWENSLTGGIPSTIWNLSAALEIDISGNPALGGGIPEGFSLLNRLELLSLYETNITGDIPLGLADLTHLWRLSLYGNRLTGSLPANLGRFSPLTEFDVVSNSLTGPIPVYLCQSKVLELMTLSKNGFTGDIPSSYATCPSLLHLELDHNKLTGVVPAGLWGSSNLRLLLLNDNNLTGTISTSIRNGLNLNTVILDQNSFTGSLPLELAAVVNLSRFSAQNNLFTGTIPGDLCLNYLNLAHNRLTGEIPEGLANCKSLNSINLHDNDLSGELPEALGNLPMLNYLDVSTNHLNGTIPQTFASLRFVEFNVSFNDLEGEIPASLTLAFPSSSFAGNPGLCAQNCTQNLQSRETTTTLEAQPWKLVLLILAVSIVVLIIMAVFGLRVCRRQREQTLKGESESSRLSKGDEYRFGKGEYHYPITLLQNQSGEWSVFQTLQFNPSDIPRLTMDDSNMIGAGATGKVYKLKLPNNNNNNNNNNEGQPVAVKKLHNNNNNNNNNKINGFGEDSMWHAEVDTLGHVRHRNIIKLLCCYRNNASSTSLLVYEYMPNGSLGDLLHGVGPELAIARRRLDWTTRHNIALGAARGLAYLHHDCVPAIVHRDVKSNNILLDSKLEPRLADFGLAKSLGGPTDDHKHAIVGSLGYIAPEYTYTMKVDEKTDVYSFGVVLLELITGRRAVEGGSEMKGTKDQELVQWAHRQMMGTSKDGLPPILDPNIDVTSQDDFSITFAIQIALHCTSPFPRRRPSMLEVVHYLERGQQPIHNHTIVKHAF